MANEHRFAVLIDADNISDKYVKFILDEISNEGVATYKRIYGDWTKPALSNWKNVLLEHSITPIQQYGYTTGKNATDAAMIIDAMDILYSGNVDGFCLVTSDSDFTRLASRLRESGMDVVGMGERKTPKAFVVACNKFKYLDILAKEDVGSKEKEKDGSIKGRLIKSKSDQLKREKIVIALPEGFEEQEEDLKTEMTPFKTIKEAVMTIIRENSDEDDWVFIGDIGNMLLKRYPDFDVRNFGFKKLTPFIRSIDCLQIKSIRHGSSMLVYVKEKEGIDSKSGKKK
ncbi:MAG TPA: NYN domain-containing protein [Anaerovoracaceae bacterium]|nr:NYN domain-containing protein [Anaerovoracaceae bacterium]